MNESRRLRYAIIAIVLFLGVSWSLSGATDDASGAYPNADLLASATWLSRHLTEDGLVVIDVREDKYFDGEVIPGAVRLPWRSFRHNNPALHVGSVFVGVEDAQRILGECGVTPSDLVVLYDSVERDGGATASYVFWILDLLGHDAKKILDGGIDAWKEAGGAVEPELARPEAVLYQAKPETIQQRSWVDGDFIYRRLGDPYYQIIDVRSREEYVGEKGNTDLNGRPLKLGHIPTAVNVNYQDAWMDQESKRIKPYRELQQLYRGLDPARGVVVYCHSGRRSSFSYFVLRLMGFRDVMEYEASWNEWGSPRNFFPAELAVNQPAGDGLPGAAPAGPRSASGVREASGKTAPDRTKAASGYVSCGG